MLLNPKGILVFLCCALTPLMRNMDEMDLCKESLGQWLTRNNKLFSGLCTISIFSSGMYVKVSLGFWRHHQVSKTQTPELCHVPEAPQNSHLRSYDFFFHTKKINDEDYNLWN
jgi:hypothetical protein